MLSKYKHDPVDSACDRLAGTVLTAVSGGSRAALMRHFAKAALEVVQHNSKTKTVYTNSCSSFKQVMFHV